MRLRITFAKTGALRYIGHLDLHKMWERTARRAGLPLAYSQGFHPQPKLQLASALPLGHSSRCELVDIWTKTDMDLAGLPKTIQDAVPSGLKILSVDVVDEAAPPLQTMVISSEFEVTLLDEIDTDQLTRSLSTLMEAESILRERRGKAYNLRPLIESLSFETDNTGLKGKITMRLTAREGATGRPDEVLDALGIPLESTRIERTGLIFKD
jgi:radical SAM-linked protein